MARASFQVLSRTRTAPRDQSADRLERAVTIARAATRRIFAKRRGKDRRIDSIATIIGGFARFARARGRLFGRFFYGAFSRLFPAGGSVTRDGAAGGSAPFWSLSRALDGALDGPLDGALDGARGGALCGALGVSLGVLLWAFSTLRTFSPLRPFGARAVAAIILTRTARLAAGVLLARLLISPCPAAIIPTIIAAIIIPVVSPVVTPIIRKERFAFVAQFALNAVAAIAACVIVVLFVTRPGGLFAPAAPIKIEIIIAVVFGLVAFVRTTPAARFVNARLVVGDHAEIVIRELEVILHLHPVTVVLGVLRKLFELVEHLRSIAARAAVNPVELAASAALRAVTAPTATVITVIIIVVVIQGNRSLSVTWCKKPAPAINRPLVVARHGLIATIRSCQMCRALRVAVAGDEPNDRFKRKVELGPAICALRNSSGLGWG